MDLGGYEEDKTYNIDKKSIDDFIKTNELKEEDLKWGWLYHLADSTLFPESMHGCRKRRKL